MEDGRPILHTHNYDIVELGHIQNYVTHHYVAYRWKST